MNKSYENFIGSVALVIENYTGVKLSIEKVAEVISDKMDREWKSYEYDEVSVYMDTSPRETIVELLARHYLGRSWPTYGDNVNVKEFYEQLEEKMKADV